MLIASFALAGLAIALAWPAPLVLARSAWPSRSPAMALILWQAIALAGGLSMIGAMLTFGLVPFGDDLIDGLEGFVARVADGSAAGVPIIHLFALSGAVLLGLHLILNLVVTVARTERQRARHRQLVQLLSNPAVDRAHTVILDDPMPLAYCLPGALRSITVFSKGLTQLLSERELQAVLEHERAHLAQRHDLVLIVFRAWYASLPWFPVAYRAQREVGMLAEMLADDRARKSSEDPVLARAIALVAAGGSEEGAMRLDGSMPVDTTDQVHARVKRLLLGESSLGALQNALVVASSFLLLAVPTVLLFVPAIVRALD